MLLVLYCRGGSTFAVPEPKASGDAESAGPSGIAAGLERVRNQLADLIPRLRTHLRVVAEESRHVERLQEDLSAERETLQSDQARLLALRADLENGGGHVSVAGRAATPDEVREALRTEFQDYLKSSATLDVKAEILSTRRRQLEEARNQLTRLIAAKKSLQLELKQIETNLQLLSTRESSFDFAKELDELQECRRTLEETRRRLLDSDHEIDQDPQIPQGPIQDVVDRYFLTSP